MRWRRRRFQRARKKAREQLRGLTLRDLEKIVSFSFRYGLHGEELRKALGAKGP